MSGLIGSVALWPGTVRAQSDSPPPATQTPQAETPVPPAAQAPAETPEDAPPTEQAPPSETPQASPPTEQAPPSGAPQAEAPRSAPAPEAAKPAPLPAPHSASNGIITGTVLSQEDHLPLPNARVGIYRILPRDSVWTLVKGALSGQDGTFRFEVPPATYRIITSCQSYTVIIKDDVQVAAGSTVDLKLSLTPKPIQIQGSVVQGVELKGSEASSLTSQKKADVVSDAITSEQISKSTDSNAAEALQRVTGLSVVDGKYVYVRGLGERYSSTQVNGTNVGTPEPNKRVLPLDVFPAGVLENVVVQKTYTPDQSAEFGGGVIDLHTKDFTEGSSFTQNIGVGYTSAVDATNSLDYQGGKLDFLGYGVGARDYPDEFKKLAGTRRVVQRGVFGGDGFTASEIQALGQSFNKTYTPQEASGKPNYSYSGSYATGFRLFGKQAGFLGALSLSNSFISVERQNNAYSGTSTRLSPLYEYQVLESNASTLGGGIANLSVHVASQQTIRFRSLYTRTTDDYSRIMAGPNYNFGTDLVQISSLDYQARGLFLGALSGEHTVSKLGSFGVDWLLSYSEASNDEPDRRENVYDSNGRGGITLSDRPTLPITRVYGDMNEYDRSAALNINKVVLGIGKRDGNLKIGGAYRYRNRISSFRRFGFTLGALGRSQLDLSLPPESLLVDENIKPGYFMFQEATRDNDTYNANQEVYAGYVMAKLPVYGKLDLLGGVRIESSNQQVVSGSPFVSSVPPVEVQLESSDALPSINVTYRLNTQMNLRAGYAVTLSRPELREMSPFDMYNFETGYSEVGNPAIKQSPIRNADLRWEFYPGPRELLSASLFGKNLDTPIENIVLGSTGGYILQPVNGVDGRLRGFEIESRIGVGRIWDAVGHVFSLKRAGSAVDRWAINFNYSRVESSVKVKTSNDADGNPIYREGPLQGQSTYALNAGLFYGTPDFQGSLMYNSFGERLAQFGAGAYPGGLPDIYEYPPTSLDFTLSKRMNSLFSLRLAGENLLNKPITFSQLGLVTREYNGGRTITLTMNIKG